MRIQDVALLVIRIYLLIHIQNVVLPAFSPATTGNVVDTGYVKYRGDLGFPNTVAYLETPYAVGELRFRAPLPLNTTPVSEAAGGKIVDATGYPNFCIQGFTGVGDGGGAKTEDCLHVSTYAPTEVEGGAGLPALVYFDGGDESNP